MLGLSHADGALRGQTAGQMGEVFGNLQGARAISPMGVLAIDGVSCSMCHQIQDKGLGQRSSFVAGFAVDTAAAFGKRQAFGPYKIDEGRQALMKSSSQFIPAEVTYIRESEICATCHTLFTEALDGAGKPVGELPEQVPYLEWRHSAYPGSRSCQSCHMPAVDGEAPITGVMGEPRPEVARHVFRAATSSCPGSSMPTAGTSTPPPCPGSWTRPPGNTIDHLQTLRRPWRVDAAEIKDRSSGGSG